MIVDPHVRVEIHKGGGLLDKEHAIIKIYNEWEMNRRCQQSFIRLFLSDLLCKDMAKLIVLKIRDIATRAHPFLFDHTLFDASLNAIHNISYNFHEAVLYDSTVPYKRQCGQFLNLSATEKTEFLLIVASPVDLAHTPANNELFLFFSRLFIYAGEHVDITLYEKRINITHDIYCWLARRIAMLPILKRRNILYSTVSKSIRLVDNNIPKESRSPTLWHYGVCILFAICFFCLTKLSRTLIS